MYKIIYLVICLLLINIFISCNMEDITPDFGDISKSTDNSLTIIYNGNMSNVLNDPFNSISIVLLLGADDNIQFILEVGEGAALQYEGVNLTLVKNQYIDNNKIIIDDGQYIFTVIAQNGDKATYTIDLRIQRKESKEIFYFEIYNKLLYIVMDINTNSQNISKTVTNVEGITNLNSYIVHSGSNISPASGLAQDFSTNNTYTVTAIDMSITNYKVSLTNYYKVTIKTNGGSITLAPVTTKYILYGEKASPPSDPSQEHYGFKGWYNTPSDGNIFSFDTPITTQTTIYAQWTNKQYRVRFYRGANLLDTVLATSLTAIPALNYPTSSAMGRTYEWYKDSGLTQAYDKSTQVTNDLDLYGDEVKSFGSIINDGSIPSDLANYDNMSELIFSNYTVGATVVPRYVKKNGIGDGSSWANASGDIQAVIDGIGDANENRVYVVLVASGHYQPIISYALKNHVALVGGFMAGSYDRVDETHLDGNEQKRLFYHNELGLNNKAILYGVVIKNGLANRGEEVNRGGGMYNKSSSPTLIEVTFLNNTCNYFYSYNFGGGMYNENSSPTLIKVTFSGNRAEGLVGFGGGMYNKDGSSPFMSEVDFINNIAGDGGGMYNQESSPSLFKVIFSGNITKQSFSYDSSKGGGMFNRSSSPTLRDVTFTDNVSILGGGMYNRDSSSPTLRDVTFTDNISTFLGGGMYNRDSSSPTLRDVTFTDNISTFGGGIHNYLSSPTLINTTFSGNEATEDGGGMYNESSSPTLNSVSFSGNEATELGGGVYSENSSPALINTTFSGNEAQDGGGMFNYSSSSTLSNVDFLGNTGDYGGGMFNYSSSSTLINATFSGNTAEFGGGIFNAYSSPALINTTFSGNEATEDGGGMYNESSSPTLNSVSFSGNEATELGGGVYSENSSPALINTTFSGNEAQDGGGMFNYSSSPTLNSVSFSGNEATELGGGLYNNLSSPTLINATFSGNTAEFGGGIFNAYSSPALINITFSGNEVNQSGGGMYNFISSSTLINVTFSSSTGNGGGIFSHNSDGQSLTLINTILWDNDKGNIFLYNDSTSDTKTVNLYYSVIEGGTTSSTNAIGIRLGSSDTNTYSIKINNKEIIDDNPGLGLLANYGGEVNIIPIGNNSPAKDKGVYVRGVKSETGNPYPEANLYYSINNADWYSDPGLTTQESPPNDADDLTATDARGYSRVGRPDMGAYEEGGIKP